MNEKFFTIKEIERLMAPELEREQLDKLHSVLSHCLLEASDFPLKNLRYASNEQALEAFLSAKAVEGCSPRTIRYYDATLRAVSAAIAKPFDEVTTDDVRAYLTGCQHEGRVSNVTVDNARRIVSSLFSWLENEDVVYKSPVRRIKKIRTLRTVKPVFTDEAIEALRDGCGNVRDLAIIDLLNSTGMRVGELVRLDRKDIDFEGRECVVRGKGAKERKVYFDARTKIHLKAYLDGRGDGDEDVERLRPIHRKRHGRRPPRRPSPRAASRSRWGRTSGRRSSPSPPTFPARRASVRRGCPLSRKEARRNALTALDMFRPRDS